ncbi:MAG TPA: glycosyl hydrolase family 28-related protein [Opitutaceae bacterium]|nr:glycosyl hydrolase family 28-related protein [Opitutaceae bacterium]
MRYPTLHSPRQICGLLAFLSLSIASLRAAEFDVRSFGAIGDGKAVDSPAINRAIEAAAAAGGGTVRIPAGTYLSFSIRLKSHLTLQLDAGATIVAASPSTDGGAYDPPEPNEWGDKQYQDFGHSHWHDSLIWGENLEDVAITGSGRLFGKGLVRGGGGGGRGGRGPQGPNGTFGPGDLPPPAAAGAPAAPPNAASPAVSGANPGASTPPPARDGARGPGGPGARGGANGGGNFGGFGGGPGSGNKTIALKNCRNVVLRDFSILQAGWFGLLATGVDNFTIDNLKVDTNRDGFDIDACRNLRIVNCSVNAPNDDAIVLKSSYALGELRACENITITGCQVSGWDPGSFLDGTFKTAQDRAPDRDGPTGRIKFGTESNGGFKNIAISNCVFIRSRGLALESVDGALIEDVAISNITMRDLSNSAIFLRLGNRARGPENTPVGAIRRVTISHVVASNVDARYPIIIAGLPGHPIEDVRISDVRVVSRGGLTPAQAAQQPADLVNTFFLRGAGMSGPRDAFNPPEQEKGYPEPSMFGLLPGYGLYARHAARLSFRDIEFGFAKDDTRPAIVLDDVAGAEFDHAKAQRAGGAAFFVLRNVSDFTSRACVGLADTHRDHVENESL